MDYRLAVQGRILSLEVGGSGWLSESMGALRMYFSVVPRLKCFVSVIHMGVRIKQMIDKLMVEIDRK